MELSGQLVSLGLAIWGAGLSTWLAIQGWRRNRTRIGLDITRNFRLGDSGESWEWIALEIGIRNGSDRPVSIVEYGLTMAHPDGTFTTSVPIHHSELPNGDSVLEDPRTQQRTAVRAHLDFLNTPVNLGPRESADGWIAFHFERPVARGDVDQHPMYVFVVDTDRKTWKLPIPGLGESAPWERRSPIIERGR